MGEVKNYYLLSYRELVRDDERLDSNFWPSEVISMVKTYDICGDF